MSRLDGVDRQLADSNRFDGGLEHIVRQRVLITQDFVPDGKTCVDQADAKKYIQ